jgi:integration host factor subunit alpha
MGTVTRENLYEAVHLRAGLPRSACVELVELVLTEMTDALEHGETVKLSGFGSFEVRQKGKRIGRNPKTGVAAPIPPRRVLVFRASPKFKQAINSRSTDSDDPHGPERRRRTAPRLVRSTAE